jgi:hypothetical protein
LDSACSFQTSREMTDGYLSVGPNIDRKSVHVGKRGRAVARSQLSHPITSLRLSWRPHSACGYLAAKTARRSWDEANSFSRLFQKHRLQTCTAQPVVFNATGKFALPAQVPDRHIEHKNAALTQVVERFCALWIGAMIHHASSPVPADAFSHALLRFSLFQRIRSASPQAPDPNNLTLRLGMQCDPSSTVTAAPFTCAWP